jgi:hypothetical protein
MFRATPTRLALATALCLIATVAIVAGAAAKGTPSNITVTCDSNVTSATVTVQLLSGLNNPTPASNQLVLACNSTDKIAPLSQPAAAYAWSAFVTGKTATFGCGGTAARGKTVTCTNDAGTSADGVVTILAT